MRVFEVDGSWESWTKAARAAVQRGEPPEEVQWRDLRDQAVVEQSALLFGNESALTLVPASDATRTVHSAAPPTFTVSRQFLEVGRELVFHRDATRWDLLYRALWRLTHGEPYLMQLSIDPDVQELQRRAKSIHQDIHKMRAFVRFREVPTAEGSWFVSWYQPDHYTLEPNAAFFRDRFAAMRWSILTPDACVHWNGESLAWSPGVPKSAAPATDDKESLWRAYYRHTFNPARLKVKTMTQHMPRRFWENMPETSDLAAMIAESIPAVENMIAVAESKTPPTEFIPADVPRNGDLNTLRAATQNCRACPLWKNATCAVFGEGPARASIMVVGEQPGDQEDRAGKPFVGPAGQLLNRAFRAAGIAREDLYVTNAVKHFKWTPSGKRRLHAKPSARELAACRPWLTAEIDEVKPDLLVCLGSTATRSVIDSELRVTEMRGQIISSAFGIPALVTLHPSALLRLPDGADPEIEFQRFVDDLKKIHGSARPPKAIDPQS